MQSVWKGGRLFTLPDKTCTPEQEKYYRDKHGELLDRIEEFLLSAKPFNEMDPLTNELGAIIEGARDRFNLILGEDGSDDEFPLPGETYREMYRRKVR